MGLTQLLIVSTISLLSICRSFAGPVTPQPQTTSVQFLYGGNGTFLEGQNVCRQINGDLATFLNKTENDNVLSDFSSYAQHFWIGLYDNKSSWTWSLDEATFNNGLDFSSWNESVPQLSVVAKICVHMNSYGNWFDALCTDTRPAVCYYDPGPSKYILVTTPMTWERAQEYCRYNYTDLASVRNLTENGNISTLLTDFNSSWIGLFREGWGQWSDLTPRNFTNFNNFSTQDLSLNQTSTASLTCARANTTTGLWSRVSCESNSSILCQVNAQTTAETESSVGHAIGKGNQAQAATAVPDVVPSQSKNTLKLRLQSDTDLNDPRIKEEILQQLQENLDNHELGGLKLHWIQADGHVFHKETRFKTVEDEIHCIDKVWQ